MIMNYQGQAKFQEDAFQPYLSIPNLKKVVISEFTYE